MTHLKITQLWAGRRGPLQTASPQPRGWTLIPDTEQHHHQRFTGRKVPSSPSSDEREKKSEGKSGGLPSARLTAQPTPRQVAGILFPLQEPHIHHDYPTQWNQANYSRDLTPPPLTPYKEEAWTTFPSSVKWPIAVWLGQNTQERVNGHMLKPKGIYRAASFSWKS